MKKTMFFGAGNFIFERAKELRKNLTSAELVLWGYLKQSPLGCKFRRQHPLGIYIVDFYCHKLKLIIEVDGDVHSETDVAEADRNREEILRAEGLDVLRFKNEEIEKSLELVIVEIENYINKKRKPL